MGEAEDNSGCEGGDQRVEAKAVAEAAENADAEAGGTKRCEAVAKTLAKVGGNLLFVLARSHAGGN